VYRRRTIGQPKIQSAALAGKRGEGNRGRSNVNTCKAKKREATGKNYKYAVVRRSSKI